MGNKFLAWIKGAVDFLAKVLTKDRLILIKEIVEIVLQAIRTVETMDGLTSEAKRATAFGLLTEDLPDIVERGVLLMKIEDEKVDEEGSDEKLPETSTPT